MRRWIVAFAVAAAGFAAPASAQSGWGMRSPSGENFRHMFSRPIDSPDWDRCLDTSRTTPLETALESCDRLMRQHVDPSAVGAFHWHRAMRLYDHDRDAEADAELELAAERFSRGVRDDPRNPIGYINRAAVLSRLHQFDAALADYDHAVALDNRSAYAQRGRGNILFRLGDYAGAAEAYDQAGRILARTGARDVNVHISRCTVHAAMQANLDRGWSFCNRAIRMADNDSYPLTARGYFQFMRGNVAEAGADFAQAVDLDRFNAAALYGRGVIAVRSGRVDEGEADMAQARDMDELEVDFYANAGLLP